MLRLRIDPEKPYRAPFICQDGLCCCDMALISFRLFRKNLGNLRDFFGQMVYRPPWQKICRTPMPFCVQSSLAFVGNCWWCETTGSITRMWLTSPLISLISSSFFRNHAINSWKKLSSSMPIKWFIVTFPAGPQCKEFLLSILSFS